VNDTSQNLPLPDLQNEPEPTGTVAASLADAVSNTSSDTVEPTANAVYSSPDAAGFGPLEDPPRVEGVELIGQPPEDDTAPALESDDPVSIPSMQQAGFVLPDELMQRAGQIGHETALITAHVVEIEKANEAADAAMAAESSDSGGDKKESK
jgi:hypothetical protein